MGNFLTGISNELYHYNKRCLVRHAWVYRNLVKTIKLALFFINFDVVVAVATIYHSILKVYIRGKLLLNFYYYFLFFVLPSNSSDFNNYIYIYIYIDNISIFHVMFVKKRFCIQSKVNRKGSDYCKKWIHHNTAQKMKFFIKDFFSKCD